MTDGKRAKRPGQISKEGLASYLEKTLFSLHILFRHGSRSSADSPLWARDCHHTAAFMLSPAGFAWSVCSPPLLVYYGRLPDGEEEAVNSSACKYIRGTHIHQSLRHTLQRGRGLFRHLCDTPGARAGVQSQFWEYR